MESQSSSRVDLRSEWTISWYFPLLATLGVAVSVMHTYSLGALMPAIHTATGWTRSQISAGPLLIRACSHYELGFC